MRRIAFLLLALVPSFALAGKFVAVGTNIAATSPDGITWTSSSIGSGAWTAVGFGGNMWVALGNGIAASSPDGITWTPRTNPTAVVINSIAWNGTRFVAVGGGSTNVYMHSTDGITWTQATLPATDHWTSIAWNGTTFCAIADVNGNSARSTTGVAASWTLGTDSYMRNIAWNGTIFAAVGNSGTTAASTPDCGTFTNRTISSHIWATATAGNGKFVAATGDSTGEVTTSTDAITWTAPVVPAATSWISVAWNGSVFALISGAPNTTSAYSSSNGTAWSAHALPSGTYRSVAANTGVDPVIGPVHSGMSGFWGALTLKANPLLAALTQRDRVTPW